MSQGLKPCPKCGNEHPEIASGDMVICDVCGHSEYFDLWEATLGTVHDDEDRLVYDGELGWIDAEFPLDSLGISCDETEESYRYRIGGQPLIQVQKAGLDFGRVRACIDDAERRSKE